MWYNIGVSMTDVEILKALEDYKKEMWQKMKSEKDEWKRARYYKSFKTAERRIEQLRKQLEGGMIDGEKKKV